MPWQLSTSEDFRYRETVGPRSLSMRILHWYTERVQIAASGDAVLSERLFEIMHLLKEPASLMTPAVWWRVLAAKFRGDGRPIETLNRITPPRPLRSPAPRDRSLPSP